MTYNNERFQLDGWMDLDTTFEDTTICIAVYVKMDAQEQLLLSEGICSQLGLVTYHPEVAATHVQGLPAEDREPTKLLQIPVMSVQLASTIPVLPHSAARADICILQDGPYPRPLLVKGDRISSHHSNSASGCTVGALRGWHSFHNPHKHRWVHLQT